MTKTADFALPAGPCGCALARSAAVPDGTGVRKVGHPVTQLPVLDARSSRTRTPPEHARCADHDFRPRDIHRAEENRPGAACFRSSRVHGRCRGPASTRAAFPLRDLTPIWIRSGHREPFPADGRSQQPVHTPGLVTPPFCLCSPPRLPFQRPWPIWREPRAGQECAFHLQRDDQRPSRSKAVRFRQDLPDRPGPIPRPRLAINAGFCVTRKTGRPWTGNGGPES